MAVTTPNPDDALALLTKILRYPFKPGGRYMFIADDHITFDYELPLTPDEVQLILSITDGKRHSIIERERGT